MFVDIRQRGLEGPHDHLTVLLTNDLVAGSTRRKDVLLSDCFDLVKDLPALGSENGFEDSARMVDQVRQRLAESTLRCHVDCVHRQLSWVLAHCLLIDILDHLIDLRLRQEGQSSDQADCQITITPILHS